MSKGAHLLLKRVKGKQVLEIGHYEADVFLLNSTYCLTEPWNWGGLTSGGHCGWTVFNLKTKDEIAEFQKKEDAIEYFKYLLKTRQ